MNDRDLVRADIADLYLGNLATVEFDLDLPSTGARGSQICWESDMPHFLAADGTVNRPAYGRGNRTVTLTATFAHGDYAETREYAVQVLEKDGDFEVEAACPAALEARAGEAVRLPGYVAARTTDGRVLSLPVEWDGGAEKRWDAPGAYEVAGAVAVKGTPVAAKVQVAPADAADAPAVPAANRSRLASLAGHTRLAGESDFLAAQERMRTWLLSTDVDQWLYSFRQAAGLPTRGGRPMLGWDSPDGLLRGHSTGHFLSALAKCWRATGDERARAMLQQMVCGLAECQRGLEARGCARGFLSAYDEEQFDLLERYTPYPKIWAPYYTLHKILAGLLDAHELADVEGALDLARGIGTWTRERLGRLPRAQLARMWSIYIAGEYGGMNEALARLARITGDGSFAATARLFDNDRLLEPLEQGADALDGMHANQHIPQVVGAVEIYRATGEARYLRLARRFWDEVASGHRYAIGGVGESEMFHAPGAVASLLTASTCESCASYNMLKLTGALHEAEPAADYMDAYERTLFSHTLATCDHRPTGGTTYFISLMPGARKDIDCEENSCCHGTGMEQPFMYAEHVFHALDAGAGDGATAGGAAPAAEKPALLVDLFIPCELDDAGRGVRAALAVGTKPGDVTLSLEARDALTLYVRRPSWCAGEPSLALEGDVTPAAPADALPGYLAFDVAAGTCELRLAFPARLAVEEAPDDPERYALVYGPYVLAALTESAEPLALAKSEAASLRQKEGSPLEFVHGATGTRFVPFERVDREAYQIYLMNSQSN